MAMKSSALLLFVAIFSIKAFAESEFQELSFQEVVLHMSLIPDKNGSNYLKVSLLFSNACDHAGVFLLPNALIANPKNRVVPTPPYLMLVVRKPNCEKPEEFGLTGFDEKPEPRKVVLIKPKDEYKIEYPLSSFYRWPASSPEPNFGFDKYFQRGKEELQVTAVVFYESLNLRLNSNPKLIYCSFPNWIFKTKE